MNEATVIHALCLYFTARRCWSVRRFELIQLEREQKQRQFLRRKEWEQFMFIMMVSLSSCFLDGGEKQSLVGRCSFSFSPQQWLDNMSQNTFQYLCIELRTTTERQDTRLRKAVPTDKGVAITLWFLATGADFWTIVHLFGVLKSTVSLDVKDVPSAILLLLPHYFHFPIVAALKEVIVSFKKRLWVSTVRWCNWWYPHNIPIVSPTKCSADYYNWKGWHSIITRCSGQ